MNTSMELNQERKTVGHCIICHQDNVTLSDEHIIPDSMGGYIHCYNVCKDCNSKLGEQVDKHLMNHFFIQGARHNHHLKGKKDAIPNPLLGDAVLKTGEKVRVEEVNGVITPHLLPTAPVISDDNRSFHVVLDKRDEKLIPSIAQKMYKKMGIKPGEFKIVSQREEHQLIQPVIEKQSIIDLKKFKIGILKIAYESCVQLFPEYENDPNGQLYAEILRTADLDRLDEVPFIGDGFQDPFELLLSKFLDYSNKKRHYIIFFTYGNELYCIVKLFDMFNQCLKMSSNSYLTDNNMVLFVNDFGKCGYEVLTMEELASKVSVFEERHYKFDKAGMDYMAGLQSESTIGFYANRDGLNLVFNEAGRAVATEVQLLLSLPENRVVDSEIKDDSFTSTYHVPSGFYFMLAPTNHLVQLEEVEVVTTMKKF